MTIYYTTGQIETRNGHGTFHGQEAPHERFVRVLTRRRCMNQYRERCVTQHITRVLSPRPAVCGLRSGATLRWTVITAALRIHSTAADAATIITVYILCIRLVNTRGRRKRYNNNSQYSRGLFCYYLWRARARRSLKINFYVWNYACDPRAYLLREKRAIRVEKKSSISSLEPHFFFF